MTLKAIKAPKDALGVKALERAIKNTLNAAAKGAQVDFKVTTRTWVTKPEFTIDVSDPGKRIVGTDSAIYGFVDKGTKPHIIRPKRAGGVLSFMGTAYVAKTTPGVIGSKASRNNNSIVNTRMVQHPGNVARKFSIVIRDKWAGQMRLRMQSAIVAALKSVTITNQ